MILTARVLGAASRFGRSSYLRRTHCPVIGSAGGPRPVETQAAVFTGRSDRECWLPLSIRCFSSYGRWPPYWTLENYYRSHPWPSVARRRKKRTLQRGRTRWPPRRRTKGTLQRGGTMWPPRKKTVKKIQKYRAKGNSGGIKISGKRKPRLTSSNRSKVATAKRSVKKRARVSSVKRITKKRKPLKKSKVSRRRPRILRKNKNKSQKKKTGLKLLTNRRRKTSRPLHKIKRIVSIQALEETAAKRLESMHLKKGLIAQSFNSPQERLNWYRELKRQKAEKSHLKAWEKRSQRYLQKLEAAVNKKRVKVKRDSMRKYIKRINPLMNVSDLTPDELSEKYNELREKRAKNSKANRVELKRKELENLGKVPDEVRLYSMSEFIEWLENEKDKADLYKGRCAAEREFKRGTLSFSPKLASDRLILLWYRQRQRGRKSSTYNKPRHIARRRIATST